MSEGAQKLRLLASQSRSLSRTVRDRGRAQMLRGLAELYERQAVELETTQTIMRT